MKCRDIPLSKDGATGSWLEDHRFTVQLIFVFLCVVVGYLFFSAVKSITSDTRVKIENISDESAKIIPEHLKPGYNPK